MQEVSDGPVDVVVVLVVVVVVSEILMNITPNALPPLESPSSVTLNH
jgi:hypothetical protein